MSNEYIAPPVVLRALTGTGARVSSRRALSDAASPFVCPGLFAGGPFPGLFAGGPFPGLFDGGPFPIFCVCPTDTTSKEATAPMPNSLAYRAIELHRDVSWLLDIFPPTSVFLSAGIVDTIPARNLMIFFPIAQ